MTLPGQIQSNPPFSPQIAYQKDLNKGRPGQIANNQDEFRSILSCVSKALIPFGQFAIYDPTQAPPNPTNAKDVSALIPINVPTTAVQITGQSDVHTITPSGVPASGTVVFNWQGAASSAINWNDTAAQIQTKIQAMTSIGTGNALVTGTLATAVVIAFAGTLANTPFAALFTFTSNSLMTSVPAAITLADVETTVGQASQGLGVVLETQSLESKYNNDPPSYPISHQINVGRMMDVIVAVEQQVTASTSNVYVRYSAVAAKNEVQTFSAQDGTATIQTPSAGSFQLVWNNELTIVLPYNATAGNIQAALQALPGIGLNNVTVTGSWAAGFVITFVNALAAMPQSQIAAQNYNLAYVSSGNTIYLSPTFGQTTQGIPAGTANLGGFRTDSDGGTAALVPNAKLGASKFDAFSLQWLSTVNLSLVS